LGWTGGVRVRMVELVLDGLRETAAEDVDRLARLDAMTFELTERGRRLRHELKRAYGERALGVLDKGAGIADVERVFGDPIRARIAVDSMLLCDAATTTAPALGLGHSISQPMVTLAGVVAPRIATGRVPTRPEDTLYDKLFDDLGDVREGSEPIDIAAVEDQLHGTDSGIVSTADLETAIVNREHAAAMRQMLVGEHQR